MDFLSFSQNHLLLRIAFNGRSLKLFELLQKGPWLAQNSPKRKKGMQFGPWTWRAVAPAKFRRLAGVPGRGSRGIGCGAHQGSICAEFEGRDGSGELARWRRVAPAAGASAPVRLRSGQDNTQTEEL
jgi:hypothetical protein